MILSIPPQHCPTTTTTFLGRSVVHGEHPRPAPNDDDDRDDRHLPFHRGPVVTTTATTPLTPALKMTIIIIPSSIFIQWQRHPRPQHHLTTATRPPPSVLPDGSDDGSPPSHSADDTTLSVVDNDADHHSTPATATMTASNPASMTANNFDATSTSATIAMIQLLTMMATVAQLIFYLVYFDVLITFNKT